MKQAWLLIVLLSIFKSTLAQKVEMLNKSDRPLPAAPQSLRLYPVKDDVPKEVLPFVATIKASGRYLDVRIGKLFAAIEKAALPLGATAYKIASYTCDDEHHIETLILDTYFIDPDARRSIAGKDDTNTVIIFGEEPRKGSGPVSLKVAEEKITVDIGMYRRYTIHPGETLKLAKGGITGAAMWLKWQEGRPPVFLSLKGFGVGPEMSGSLVGASFNTGRFNTVEPALAYLLLSLFREQK
jgi:hypothetical protein